MSTPSLTTTQPLTAPTREQVDATQVRPDSTENGDPPEPLSFAEDYPEYVPVAPSRVESRLSIGQGGFVLSDDELSEHPLAEVSEGEMRSHRDEGNALPHDFTTDSDFGEDHEPVDRREGERHSHVSSEAAVKKEVKPPFGWPPLREYPMWYFKRLIGCDQSQDVFGFYPAWDQIVAFVFVCVTMVVLGIIEHYGFRKLGNGTISAFIPAFGATCTVVYGVPKAPIAQPRNVVIAHVSASIIGVALTNAFRSVDERPFAQNCAGAIGVGLHLALMMVTNTMHPPASATVISAAIHPINAYYKDEGFFFCLSPVLFGSLVVVIMAWILNNIFVERGPYPQYW